MDRTKEKSRESPTKDSNLLNQQLTHYDTKRRFLWVLNAPHLELTYCQFAGHAVAV